MTHISRVRTNQLKKKVRYFSLVGTCMIRKCAEKMQYTIYMRRKVKAANTKSISSSPEHCRSAKAFKIAICLFDLKAPVYLIWI